MTAAHKPTPDKKFMVRNAAIVGIPHEVICQVIRVSEKTLRKHYKRELELGSAEADAAVAGRLFQHAMGTGPGAVAACIFWLKSRAGWRETAEPPDLLQPDNPAPPKPATWDEWLQRKVDLEEAGYLSATVIDG